jgi:flagellar motor switch protein FliM
MWYLRILPLKLHLALCLEPALVHTIMSVMLGGGNVVSSRGRQTITDLEQSIIESAIVVFCTELRHAWSRISEVELEIDNRETRPRLLRIYPPNEGMVIIAMSMKVGMTESGIYWGVPGAVLKGLQDNLSHHRKIESEEKLLELASKIKDFALSFPTRIEAELCQTDVKVSELLSLEIGDVLRIEHLVENPALVKVNGSDKFLGNVVLSNDHKAVRLA